MAKSKSRERQKSEKSSGTVKQQIPSKDEPKWMPIAKHLAVYLFLLIAAMLYFKPVAFEGKSLQQHDNQQSMQMLTEYTDYKDNQGYVIRWTNQIFGGMPTSIMINQNMNYCNQYVLASVRLFQPYNEWVCLLLIMFGAYLGLALLGVDILTATALSLMLGFFTANTLFISAGHTGKMNVLATVPLIVGAMIFAWRKNLLLGASIVALGMSINFSRNHVQISYYMFFVLAIIGLFLLFEAIKEEKLPQFAKFATAMIVATLLGLFSNLGLLWPNYQYGDSSTRGKSELTKKTQVTGDDPNAPQKEHTSGLSWDYVFGLSIEKMETAALMFPNFHGGTQAKSFYSKEGSATAAAVNNPGSGVQQEILAIAKSQGFDGNQFMNQVIGQYTRQYRGSQTMSGGPIYYGVVVCFLFILAMFLLQGAIKWGIVSSLVFLLFLAWGKHFAIFNNLMFDYFPLYNKFRDTKMTLLVAQPIVILAIGLGLRELMNFDPKKYENTWGAKILPMIKQQISKEGYVLLAGFVALDLCILAFLYASMGTMSSPNDEALMKISPKLLVALQADRAAMIQADVFRAVGFILPALAAMYFYAKGSLKQPIAMAAVALIACVDLGMVNSEYVNEDSYVKGTYDTRAEEAAARPTQADLKIMSDKSYFRVADYSQGPPSQSARASSFHKSVGGYFAAKPLLYQEFWNGHNMDDGNTALKTRGNLFNMLNVKYFIVSPTNAMENPAVLGPVWFVNEVQQVDDANQELEALNTLAPHTTAVVQKKNATSLKGLANTPSPTDRIYLKGYHPDTMTYVSETTNERFAVFSEMYYPPENGWNVYINDQKVDGFIKTNFLLRGMRIPKGKNVIKMVFEPQAQILGGKIGMFSSILIILLFGFFSYKYFATEPVKEEEEA